MRPQIKPVALAVLVAALAIIAGVTAVRAWAATETYCDSCSISNTPAVSATRAFTSNFSSTFQAKKQHIYYYNVSSGIQSGDESSGETRVFGLNHTGSPSTGTATARCHLLNDGSTVAICWANY